MAEQALEQLVGTACLLVEDVLLNETHVACVNAEAVADSLFYHLLNGRLHIGLFRFTVR